MTAMLVMLLSPGCDEHSFGPQAAPTPAPSADKAAAPPSVPTLTVGNVSMPLPTPNGFKRIASEDPLMRAAQRGLGSEETLLCLFARSGGDPLDTALPPGTQRQDILQVSTLNKWLHARISPQDFLQLKRPWQDESIVFNQNTLRFFEEAAQSSLRPYPQFTYNLGMIDSSPQHISFLKVVKQSPSEEEAVYVCSTTSLLWRQGKILRLTYNRRISDFSQIRAVVAESVGYLQKLQNPLPAREDNS